MPLSAQHTAGLILAAGAASRMGENKMLLPWNGGTLLDAVTSGLLDAGIKPLVTVLGCRAAEIEAAYAHKPQVTLTLNRRWQEGMYTSVQQGLRTLLELGDWQAFLLQPGDIPCAAVVIPALLDAYTDGGPHIIIPTCQGKGGHPALFSRAYAEEIIDQDLPQGLKTLLERHRDQVLRLPVAESGVLLDLDTPADYRQARSALNPR